MTDTSNPDTRSSDTNSFSSALGSAIRIPVFKLILIAILILVLMVPMTLVGGLIGERESRAEGVRSEVASLWGGSQLIVGPVLVVPYSVLRVTTVGDRRVEEVQERRAVFLPETLTVRGDAKSTTLHRSIFEFPVYTSELAFEGRFGAPRLADVAAQTHDIRWRDAVLAVAISDVSGLKATINAVINGADTVPLDPSLGIPGVNLNGVHLRLAEAGSLAIAGDPASPGAPIPAFGFRFDLRLNGSNALDFTPVARETTIELKADWPHPSFGGAFLPVERTVRPDGFSARWYVPHLARSVPQAWNLHDGGLERIRPYGFGTRFFTPVDFYKLVTRASKYVVIFLSAAFMAVFLLEFRSAHQVHPVQYGFVGFAMVFFYVLLLSFAEHLGFVRAYMLAAVATGGLLAAYVGRVQQSLAKGAATFAIFLTLYGLLYMILRMEDYALLAGAILGFVLLATVMFSTLRVDWSGGGRPMAPAPIPAPAPVRSE